MLDFSIPTTKKQALVMMAVPVCFMLGLSLYLMVAVPDIMKLLMIAALFMASAVITGLYQPLVKLQLITHG